MTSKSTLASLIAIVVVASAARAQGTYKRDIPDSLAAKSQGHRGGRSGDGAEAVPQGRNPERRARA